MNYGTRIKSSILPTHSEEDAGEVPFVMWASAMATWDWASGKDIRWAGFFLLVPPRLTTMSEPTVIVSDEVEEEEERGESGLSDSGGNGIVVEVEWDFVELLMMDSGTSMTRFSFSSSSTIWSSFSGFAQTGLGFVVSVDSV